jgi:hypothetical protein
MLWNLYRFVTKHTDGHANDLRISRSNNGIEVKLFDCAVRDIEANALFGPQIGRKYSWLFRNVSWVGVRGKAELKQPQSLDDATAGVSGNSTTMGMRGGTSQSTS